MSDLMSGEAFLKAVEALMIECLRHQPTPREILIALDNVNKRFPAIGPAIRLLGE